jgi:hypothetical protein
VQSNVLFRCKSTVSNRFLLQIPHCIITSYFFVHFVKWSENRKIFRRKLYTRILMAVGLYILLHVWLRSKFDSSADEHFWEYTICCHVAVVPRLIIKGFWTRLLDFLTPQFTLTLNYNKLQQLTINDRLRPAPFLIGLRVFSLLLWLTWFWLTNP